VRAWDTPIDINGNVNIIDRSFHARNKSDSFLETLTIENSRAEPHGGMQECTCSTSGKKDHRGNDEVLYDSEGGHVHSGGSPVRPTSRGSVAISGKHIKLK